MDDTLRLVGLLEQRVELSGERQRGELREMMETVRRLQAEVIILQHSMAAGKRASETLMRCLETCLGLPSGSLLNEYETREREELRACLSALESVNPGLAADVDKRSGEDVLKFLSGPPPSSS